MTRLSKPPINTGSQAIIVPVSDEAREFLWKIAEKLSDLREPTRYARTVNSTHTFSVERFRSELVSITGSMNGYQFSSPVGFSDREKAASVIGYLLGSFGEEGHPSGVPIIKAIAALEPEYGRSFSPMKRAVRKELHDAANALGITPVTAADVRFAHPPTGGAYKGK